MSERTLLDEITIHSIGVIERATLELSPGLTVLTGETGAGKTMILTALNLILGGKSDSALIRTGSPKLVVSGRFSIPLTQIESFDECGVLIEEGELILTRAVSADGKSKATSNGISVPVSTLSAVSELLVEVHAQAANVNISKNVKQRELLDKFAGIVFERAIESYSKNLSAYHDLKRRILGLHTSIDKQEQELAELREFVKTLTALKLKRGEYAEMSTQIDRLSNVEALRIASSSAFISIDNEETGALSVLGQSRRALEVVRTSDPALNEIFSLINEGYFLIDEARANLASYMDSLEADPALLDYLNARKAEIHRLIKKYGGSGELDWQSDELVRRYEVSAASIADLEGGDDRLKELEDELIDVKKKLVASAKAITKIRSETAVVLSKAVTDEIQQLSMPQTTFSLKVESANYQGLRDSDFTPSGCDEAAMFISAHKGAPVVSLAKSASGGEMSRVMLALEVVIAESHPVGTYVFDEVDAGVGGKAAIEVGRRLHRLSQHAQVVVVTHLPQVAAWADSHFVVTKEIDGSVSQSNVRKVQGDDRIEEIARMLAGFENSVSAREHAAELLSMKE